MRDAFFNLNFLKAHKICNAHAIFRQLSHVKNGGRFPNNQASLVSWLPVNPDALELSCPKES